MYRKNPFCKCKAWLYAQYVISGKDQETVAQLAGCTVTAVRGWLTTHGIPIRPRDLTHFQKPPDLSCVRDFLVRRGLEVVVIGSSVNYPPPSIGSIRLSDLNISKDGKIPVLRDVVRRALISHNTLKGHASGVYGEEWLRKGAKAKKRRFQRGGHSEETKRRMSVSQRQRFVDHPEKRREVGKRIKTWWASLSKEERSRIYAAPERTKRISEGVSAAHARGVYDHVMGQTGPTGIEIIVSNTLDALGVKHIPQYRIPGVSYIYDEYLPDLGIVLEVHGSYWHANSQERDEKKKQAAEAKGLRYAAVWDYELDDPATAVVEKKLV